jgi:hypothetical protein
MPSTTPETEICIKEFWCGLLLHGYLGPGCRYLALEIYLALTSPESADEAYE